jgi:hypothetical protein
MIMFGSYYPVSGFGAYAQTAPAAAQAAAMGRGIAQQQAARRAMQAIQAAAAQTIAARAAQAMQASRASAYAAGTARGTAIQQAQLATMGGRPASAARILQQATQVPASSYTVPPLPSRYGMVVPVPPAMLTQPAMPPQMLTVTPGMPPSMMIPVPASGYKPTLPMPPTMAMYGFGATPALTIDPVQVWDDWYSQDNKRTKSAATWIQAALNQLGYGVPAPLVVDGDWGTKSKTAYNAVSAAQGPTSNAGYMTQDGVQKISDLLNAGQKPGPADPVSYRDEGGVLVPTTLKKAGLGTGLLVAGGAAVAIILGGLVLSAKKKHAPHMAAPMHANRRRRRRGW